jgi:prefoldin subunit 5
MKVIFMLALLCAPACALEKTQDKVTPVQKVLELMGGMLEKGKKDKHDEVVQFAAYKEFCENTKAEKEESIAEANEAIVHLKADIQKFTATAAKLKKEIAELDEDIAVWKGDENAATKVREIEATDYEATHKDYSESIDALQRAIAVLKKQDHDRKQETAEAAKEQEEAIEKKESLVQVSSLTKMSLIPEEAKRAIEAFMQQDPESSDMLAYQAPESAAYEFQSQGIIEMLEKLQDKFMGERTTLEKDEMNSRHAYEMLMQDLKNQISFASKDREEKATHKAKTLQKKSDAEGDLQDTITTRDEDAKYLAELVSTCEDKASDFEARQQLRMEELEAIQKAMEIVSSEAVAGSAEEHLPTLIQDPAQVPAFTQLRSDLHVQAKSRVVAFLKRQAKKLNSRVLSAVAERSADDPFAKVKKMIKDLITKLMEEATEEAEHKGWCDTELGTNEQTRIEKTEAVETLHAEIDQLTASIAKLTDDLKDLTKAVAELDAAMAKATKLRQEEKAKNTDTIEDAAAAQKAVAAALIVLREFYSKAAEATALLQQEPPPIFDEPYKGMQAENGGIVGMLEVIESDFARLEGDTKAAEATAQKEYDEFMEESKIDKARKTQAIESKTAKKEDQEKALVQKKADLEGTQKELDAALAYYDKLKPSCVDAGVSYEDRVARRKEEIESLQEALRILNGEDIA